MSTSIFDNKEILSQGLHDLKDDNNVVSWSHFVCAFKEDITSTYGTKYSAGNIKSMWMQKIRTVASHLGIVVDTKVDNWYIIERLVAKKKSGAAEGSRIPTPPDASWQAKNIPLNHTRSTGTSSARSESSKSKLGSPLASKQKADIGHIYSMLDKKHLWKLSSGRYVEEVMRDFTLKLNYEHPSCSVILDVDDSHWVDTFTPDELIEMKQAIPAQTQHLPSHMEDSISNIPKTNTYWLKMSLQNTADLLITKYLPITTQNERELIQLAWSFIQTAYDGSKLTLSSERGCLSSMNEKNKKRRVAAIEMMDRKRSCDISDMLIHYDIYEFGAAEVGKSEADHEGIQ
ncbi:hypothetical protein BDB01DRAFT_850932 [Pilobolus umbonatus]|nr:hypothetical protein BDB01DRAFT_850932 [Pilobolus umbonatus]